MPEPMRRACAEHASCNASAQCAEHACGDAMRNATVRNGTGRHETARIQDPGRTPHLPYAPGPVDKGFQRRGDWWGRSDAEFRTYLETTTRKFRASSLVRRRLRGEARQIVPYPDRAAREFAHQTELLRNAMQRNQTPPTAAQPKKES